MLPWTPEFQPDVPQNLMQPFPPPDNASHKIWSRLAIWYKRYTYLKLWTDDDGLRSIGILTALLSLYLAQVSMSRNTDSKTPV